MKGLRALVTNPVFIGWVLAIAGSFFVLSRGPEFELGDNLIQLALFGLVLPLIAWLALWPAKSLTVSAHPRKGEMLALVGYVIALSIYLAFGPQTIDAILPQAWVTSPHIHFVVKLALKLIVFVALPFAIF